MENTKKSSEFEPTLLDVLEAVQTGFTKMEKRFEKVEKQLDRHEGILITLHEGQEGLRELLNECTSALDKRVSATQNRVEDVVDILEKEVPGFHLTQPMR
ncbi:MAG: hypothetical protein AAB951_01505 [Patescibacteria group bacterium]